MHGSWISSVLDASRWNRSIGTISAVLLDWGSVVFWWWNNSTDFGWIVLIAKEGGLATWWTGANPLVRMQQAEKQNKIAGSFMTMNQQMTTSKLTCCENKIRLFQPWKECSHPQGCPSHCGDSLKGRQKREQDVWEISVSNSQISPSAFLFAFGFESGVFAFCDLSHVTPPTTHHDRQSTVFTF